MNDFTKEELETIRGGIDWWLDNNNWKDKHQLVRKIQSMIDNYCDHDQLKKQITKAIDSCKAYGTKESEMLIFAYQNVLKWMAKTKV